MSGEVDDICGAWELGRVIPTSKTAVKQKSDILFSIASSSKMNGG
jgi:hypothetical protein